MSNDELKKRIEVKTRGLFLLRNRNPEDRQSRVGRARRQGLDEVYAIGFKNGQVEMRNNILKSINRDWSLITNADLLIKVMKKINRIKLLTPNLPALKDS